MNDLSLVEAADAIARGEVTSVQLTQTALSRARELGSKLNCIARLDTDDALRAAEQADRERKQGTTRGALHGVPLAHKDLFYRKGKVVACGSKIRRDFVPDLTASVLQRLDAAGAIDIGSLHMAEFAFSPSGYNEHYGHCRNPWNTAHVPGGSSSGSGAAVAARIIFASLGTDTGGSLRHPAPIPPTPRHRPSPCRATRRRSTAKRANSGSACRAPITTRRSRRRSRRGWTRASPFFGRWARASPKSRCRMSTSSTR